MKLRTCKIINYCLIVDPKYVSVAVSDLFEAAGEGLLESKEPLEAGDVVELTIRVRRPVKKKKKKKK